MARTDVLPRRINSKVTTASGSQFVICADNLRDQAKTFTIFGTVTDGLDVLDRIVAVPRTYGADGTRSKPSEPVNIVSLTVTAA